MPFAFQSSLFASGSSAEGYTSNDPYYSNVITLLHANGNDGSNILADTTNKHAYTSSGATLSTSQKKYGTASIYFSGTGKPYFETPFSNDFYFGTNDFTIEFYIKTSYTTANANGWCVLGSKSTTLVSSSWGVYCGVTGKILLWCNAAANQKLTSKATITDNVWHHIAFIRRGATVFLFIDGIYDNSIYTWVTNMPVGDQPFRIGDDGYSARDNPNGYLDEIRITKGVARYLPSFDPWGTEYYNSLYTSDQYSANVVSFTHLNGTNNSTTVTDQISGNTWTAVNTGKIVTAQSVYGGSSLYLDTNQDYFRTPAKAAFDFGTNDFTIECYFKTNMTIVNNTTLFANQHTSTGYGNWGVYLYPTYIRFIYIGMTGTYYYVDAIKTPTDNVWHHIMVVRSGATIGLYVDGVFYAANNNFLANMPTDYTTYLHIGNDGYQNRSFYNGYLDEIRYTVGVIRQPLSFGAPTTAF